MPDDVSDQHCAENPIPDLLLVLLREYTKEPSGWGLLPAIAGMNSDDPVATLYIDCFRPVQALAVWVNEVHRVCRAASAGEWREVMYFHVEEVLYEIYLASLFVLCAGFRRLDLRDKEIEIA